MEFNIIQHVHISEPYKTQLQDYKHNHIVTILTVRRLL